VPSLPELKKTGITAIVDLNKDLEDRAQASEAAIDYVVDYKLEIPQLQTNTG
jgi:hypothetical protein